MDNIRRRIVGAIFTPSMFEDRCVDLQCSMCRVSKIDVSTFNDQCVSFRRSMCRLSKINNRCVGLRRSTIDVSTFEDRCVDLRTSVVDVKLCCILVKNIDTIVVCELRRGFALQCFHYYCRYCGCPACVCVCPFIVFAATCI